MQTLNVLTTEHPLDAVVVPLVQPCTGGYDCACNPCVAERASRMRRSRKHAAQPWEPRKAA